MCKIIKNRFLPILLTLSLVMSMLGVLPIGVFALEQESQIGEYTFVELNGNFCAITKYNGSDSEVTIPSTLDGLMVQKISSGAFQNNTTLESVVLSEYIETVESNVFYGCTSLTYVGFDSELRNIGSYAFNGCSGLTTVTLPENLKTIDYYAFGNCTGLESITIPDGVTGISGYAFRDCTNLSSVTLPKNWNTVYVSSSSYDDYSPFYGCSKLTEITIPNGMVSIPSYAFYNCSAVEKVNFPDSLTTIGSYAFNSCTGLTSVNFPESLSTINYYAFNSCTGLTSVNFPESLTTINSYAFSYCTGLTSVTIPENVTSINNNVFNGCSGLTTVTLPESLKTIDYYAFGNCTGLESIIIPDGVTGISGYAFRDCTNLSSVTLPKNWNTVYVSSSSYDDYSPFYGCSKLTEITIPNGMTAIPSYAFYNCSAVKKVNFPDSLTTIDYYAFNSCTGLTSVNFPESLSTIKSYAFSYCTGLTSVTIPVNVTSINNNVFNGCSGLTTITLPESLKTIDYYAFGNCTGLKSIIIPDGVTGISGYAFRDCTNLSSVTLPKNWNTVYVSSYSYDDCSPFYGCSKLTEITIPNGMTAIPSYAFEDCDCLDTVFLSDTVVSIGNYSFAYEDKLDKIWIPSSVSTINNTAFKSSSKVTIHGIADSYAQTYAESKNIPFSTEIIKTEKATVTGKVIDKNGNGIENVVISLYNLTTNKLANQSVKTDINGTWSFSEAIVNNRYVVSYIHPNYKTAKSVVTISNQGNNIETITLEKIISITETPTTDFTYSVLNGTYCSITGYTGNGTEVIIPSKIDGYKVQKISSDAFKNKSAIEKVALAETVETVESNGFYGCTNLTYVGFDSELRNIGSYAFNGCSGLTTVTLPESLKTIDYYAFGNCTGLESIIIPDGVTGISGYAFRDCTNLSSVTLPKNWNTVYVRSSSYDDYSPFYGCSKLTEITIPNGMVSIPSYAFYNCSAVKKVNFPDSLTTIGSYAFNSCTGLTSVNFPESLTTINSYAFSYCTGLTSVTIPENVTSINNNVFNGCSGLTTVTLPESLKTIDYCAFGNCTGLESVIIPDGVTGISGYAFRDCTNLSSVTLPKNWNTVYVSSSSYDDYSPFYGCSKLTEITIPNGMTAIPSYAFYNCSAVNKVNFPDSLTTIDSYAFNSCTGLTRVNFPELLTTIGSYAFSYCTGLTSVTIPVNVTSINNNVFNGCSGLTTITLPESLKTIDYYAFGNCTGLKSIIIPDGVTGISGYAFRDCTNLSNVTLPKNWNTVYVSSSSYDYYSPFYGCSKLTEITIPNGMTAIPSYAFKGCTSIKTVTFPESLSSIGNSSFNGCTHISELDLPGSVKRIESYAFYGCRGFRMLNFNDDLEYIGNYSFYGCDGLLSLVLNENLVTLSDRSFGSCANLSAARVPRSVTSFAKDSFYGCPKLKIYCYKDSAAHLAIKDSSYDFFLLDDHEHDYEITIETEATCTRGGSQIKTCKLCGYNFIELVEPLGHDYQCVVTPPTCTERGYATYTCSRCQDSYVDNYTNPTGHIYGEWIIDTQATCQKEGSKHRLCTVCNHRDIDSIPKNHDYTVEVVSPTCTEKGYTLYTCKTCGTSHKDNYTDATGHSFGEWIVDEEATCQRMGSKHRVCSKCGKQQVDTIPRTEHNYQDEIVAPTCTEKGYTLHTCTICGISHKDTYVDAKGHTFGEWIVDKGATVLNEGKKHHVCQVCGKTENATIDKVVVDVNSNPNYGLAVFTVVDAQTKEPIPNASIFVSTETEGEATFFTDAAGHAKTVLPVGKHMISAYADGCLTRNLKINVTSGTNNIPQIGLSSQKTYTAEVTHHLMDLEEIEEAGIDTSAADNKHVYKYELKLEFQPEIDWLSLFYYMGDTGEILGGGGSGVAPDGGGGGGGGGSSSQVRTGIVWIPPESSSGSSGGGHFYIPPTESEPATTIYPVSEHFYLIIRGEVRWLKEMFDVEMLVVNNSMTDTLENLNATLEIPEGLSLATMKETQQELSQELGTIAEGEKKSAHWFVRGDTAGSYNVGARLQGMIMPFEEPIDDYFEAQNPLHVWAGNALHLHFEFPDAAYYGEDYPITITLENVSDITLYNISHAVQIEQGMEIFYSDGTSKSRIERSQWETVGVKEFYPGDKIIIEASVNIFFKSEMMEQKLQQWIGFVDDVEQLMNAFKMLKTAYSATESLINCVSGCSRALDGFVASAGTSADKVELFKQLHGKISGLMLSYSKSGNKTLDAAVKLANSGVSASLNAITDNPDEWLKNHSVNDIKKLIKNVESLENSITNNSGQSARFDIYDSIRTAISAIPVKFALKSVTMTEDKNNTTSIPWSYSISNSGAHYFGVSNVSKYLSSIAKAAMAEIYESEMPGYLQLIPGLDDPFNKDDVISYVKATENEIAQFQAKGATGKVTFHSWVERKNPVQPLLLNNVQPKFNLLATPTSDFLLSCDNETATFENGVLTFTGDGVISVTPQSGYDGTLYIQDSDGNLYTYEMDVVPEHTCCATEEEIVIPPTAEYDGFAVKRCDTCGDVLEIIPLVNEQLCSEHSFGEWKIDTEPTSTECGLRERNCTVCGYTEYETVDTVSHTFGEWHVTKPATCSEEGEESATCEDCGEVITRAIAKLAHTEGMWQIVKEPTATEEGEKQLACSVCGEVLKTEVIPKLENGIVIGDVNNDGNVDSVDAALLSSYLESKISLTNYQKISADINRDRILNQEDVTLILQYYALGKNGDYAGLSDLAGDVNGDGDTNISDATCIQRALAEYFDFTELDAIIADVNGDGIANISDVTALQRYLAEIEKNICVSQVNVLPYSVRTDRVLKLGVGESSELNVRILPLSLNDFNLIWTSSDETVATVSSDGIIKAVGMGTAQITIKVQNGPKTSCNVLVNENSDYTFTQNEDDTITITGYTGSETSLIIPSTIYGKTVKSIAANAFKNNTQITNIGVSNGISSIGEGAFAYCSKLESVTLPDSVIEIGRAVMRGCVKLTQVNLSEGLTVLPDHAFENCVLLSQIELPSNLKEIGSRAFMNCKSLDNFSLPQCLTTIGAYAFDSCEKIRNISIPDSVTSIENSAFGYCTALTSIALPPEITTIAAHLFNHSGIASITIPNKVKKIEDYAFFSCSNLANVALPDSLTNIGKYAFCSCSTLTSISIPNGVTYIGDSAFSDCSGLTSITIPDSVTSIGSHAFYACSALANITIPDGITSIEMYTFCGCSGLPSVTIPNGITSIGKCAFSDCSGFSSVTIPESVTSIGEHAFGYYYNDGYQKYDDFTIIGYIGSSAEAYADDNGLSFENIDKIYSFEVVGVEAGGYHSAALSKDGSLYLWGSNNQGQLGNQSIEDSLYPIKVMENVEDVSLGTDHSAALTKNGSLYLWGGNSYGQLGNGTTTSSSVPVKILDNVIMFCLGDWHSGAVTTDGSLYMWGNNEFGQLGNGSTINSPTPIKVMDNVKTISLGSRHSAAITNDGSLYSWGENYCGKVGDGTTVDKHSPVKIMDNVLSVSFGGEHSAAITTDGTLYTWGRNDAGQLGDGTTNDRTTPVQIAINVRSISMGFFHSTYVSNNNILYTWGFNQRGELGNGSTNTCYSPQRISENIAQVSAGRYFSIALTVDKKIMTCGYNDLGELGDGTTISKSNFNVIEIP